MHDVAWMRQDMRMPGTQNAGRSTAGRALGTSFRGARATVRGGTRFSRWVGRYVLFFRTKAGAGEPGMMRLLDLHAASCAGDTLVTMSLATTVFFSVPAGEARGRVALYLFITMVPFALLAPVVGPLLDRFRHGRRYALAVTMLGRAFLAWLISDYLGKFGFYPAAFGVLALSRAYGVARSAAVPRLLPPELGLSQAGARASVFGTLAGAAVAPLGVAALTIGPQWPLRVAAVIFGAGAVVALRLPAKADSAPPEVVPRILQMPGRRTAKMLSGPLLVSMLTGSGALRALNGFLTLFLAFAIRAGHLDTHIFGVHLSGTQSLGLAIGVIGMGGLVATAVGARLRIHRPAAVQAIGILVTAIVAVITAVHDSFGMVVAFGLTASVMSGMAKLALDATIQERVDEDVRASAFAHSETLMMLAWVVGGGVGLIPLNARLGIGVAAVGISVAAAYTWMNAVRLRKEKLSGQATGPVPTGEDTTLASDSGPTRALPAGPTREMATAVTRPAPIRRSEPATRAQPSRSAATRHEPTSFWGRRRGAKNARPETAPSVKPPTRPVTREPGQPVTSVLPRTEADQPGFHLYRPSSTEHHEGDRDA
jgi:MFS family permease